MAHTTHPALSWHSRILLSLVLLLLMQLLPPAARAQDGQYAGTINRMEIRRMKAEFESHGRQVCSKIKQDALPQIQEVARLIADTSLFNQRLAREIASLRTDLRKATQPERRYELAQRLYQRYSIVMFDSAYAFARRAEQAAVEMGDADRTALARADQMAVLTNCGFFREATDIFEQTDQEGCTSETRAQLLIAAFNLEFENGFFIPYRILPQDTYLDHMQRYAGQIEALVGKDAWVMDDLRVKMYFHQARYAEAVEASKRLLEKLSPESDYYANALGNMGFNYMGMGDMANATRCIAQSAQTEIRRGSRVYPAARKLAEVAYILGDISSSYRIIQAAMRNAEYYHSQYRYSEVAKSYPKIENDLNDYIESQKTRLTVGLVVLVAVVLLLAGAIVVTIRQRRTLHRQKSLIEAQVHHLSDKSTQIERINHELQEAGHIKEVVLGQLIVGSANHQAAIEKLRKEVLRRLTIKDYDGLRTVFDTQRGAAFDSFLQIDSILLMLFPDFCTKFNALLRPENRTQPHSGERLTTEMRIFALIRLGIHKNDDLTRSLNYSVNTIKSYKTRVLAASPYDKEEFYRRLNTDVVAE